MQKMAKCPDQEVKKVLYGRQKWLCVCVCVCDSQSFLNVQTKADSSYLSPTSEAWNTRT